MNTTYFIDFDGTITKNDTCYAMVKAFAKDGWEEINRLWEEKKISTVECAQRTFELFSADVEAMENLLYSIEIDEFFKEFLSICGKYCCKVFILSDGYDFSIERILKKHGIDVKFYSNKLIYDENKGFTIESPFLNPSCGKCGTCKSGLMEKLKTEDSQIIYIGDGYSDTCPAGKADKVYAKGSLYKYCSKNGIAAVPFTDFGDIISKEFEGRCGSCR